MDRFTTSTCRVVPFVYRPEMSVYEILCKLTGKTNEIIDLLNSIDIDAIQGLRELLEIIGTTDYVETIVKKLNVYPTVADMLADDNLMPGMYAATLGYYAVSDGGSAWYRVLGSGTASWKVLASGGKYYETVYGTVVNLRQFGAQEGHDVTSIFSAVCADESISIVVMPEGEFVMKHGTITTPKTIVGSHCKLDGEGLTVMICQSDDIEITDIDFTTSYSEESDSCIIWPYVSLTSRYDYTGAVVSGCSFGGGAVFGVNMTNVREAIVENCEFYDFTYRPEVLAGGYGVLLQSCEDVTVRDCSFKAGDKGRHDIYVSVLQGKTAYMANRNIEIRNVSFDHSEMEFTTRFYSDRTTAVNVRYTIGFSLENARLNAGTGIFALVMDDGISEDVKLSNLSGYDLRWVPSSAAGNEQRNFIGIAGALRCMVENVDHSVPNAGFSTLSINTGEYIVRNTVVRTNVVIVGNTLFDAECIYHRGGGAFIDLANNSTLRGKLRSFKSDVTYPIVVFRGDDAIVENIDFFPQEQRGPYKVAANGTSATSPRNGISLTLTNTEYGNKVTVPHVGKINGVILNTWAGRSDSYLKIVDYSDNSFEYSRITLGLVDTNDRASLFTLV